MNILQNKIIIFTSSQPLSSNLHRRKLFLFLFNLVHVLFQHRHCFFFFLIFSLLLLLPFWHLCVTVASCWFFGEHWLTGFLHGKNLLQYYSLVQLVSRETEFIFLSTQKLPIFQSPIKFLTPFTTLFPIQPKDTHKIFNHLIQLCRINGRFFFNNSCNMFFQF